MPRWPSILARSRQGHTWCLWRDGWVGRAIYLLAPIAVGQAKYVLQSEVLAMDETAIKAGRTAPGKMRQAYFWPVYGDANEMVFPYAPTCEHRHVKEFLGG